MYDHLRSLLQSCETPSNQQLGQIIDYLKQILHFNNLNQQLGTQYLTALVPLLQPFTLRIGFSLINEADQYILVQGKLNLCEKKYGGCREWEAGRLIDFRDRQQVSFQAQTDCSMIRVNKSNSHNLVQKKVLECQKDKNRKYKDYCRLVEEPNHQYKLQILKNSSFLSSLGNYDMFEMTIGSSLKEYGTSSLTHQMNEKVDRIGYLVSGKVKLAFTANHKARRDNSITWFLNEKDWIGLEEFLWGHSYQSTGQVSTVGAVILWIPRDLFCSKFNQRANNQAITRLTSLIKTKKVLFDRSLTIRRKKEEQIQVEKDSKRKPSSQLANKMVALQGVKGQVKKKMFNRSQPQLQKKDEVLMPEFMVHKFKNLSQQPVVLPRVNQKTIFFPEEYANYKVTATHKKQMDRLESIIKPKQSESHLALGLNPQNLYKTIYNRIAYRFPKDSMQRSANKTIRQEHSPLHFNSSIYNNFRVKRGREEMGQLKKNRTLSIISAYK